MGEQIVKPSFKDVVKQCGGDLNKLTKSLIVTLKITNNTQAEDIKKEYFEKFVTPFVKNQIKEATPEELKRILMIEELELEIQQLRLKIVKAKAEEKNVSVR